MSALLVRSPLLRLTSRLPQWGGVAGVTTDDSSTKVGRRPRWKDRFGSLSEKAVLRHEQQREARDLGDQDEEDKYLDKIGDSTR